MRRFLVALPLMSLLIARNMPAQKLSFEVVSVKPNKSGSAANSISTTGCRFLARNVTLGVLINVAYRPPNGQLRTGEVIGGPAWIDTDRFDVEAKPDDTVRSLQQPDMQTMVRALLEDRFQLKLHRETREMPVYDLVIGKELPKIKLSDDQTSPQAAPMPCTPAGFADPTSETFTRPTVKTTSVAVKPGAITMTMTAAAAPLSDFANMLKSYAGRPVFDKTGLKGVYDFTLHFAVENSGSRNGDAASPDQQIVRGGDPSGDTLLPAIQHQLGLKLESTKGPVEVLVIDSAQKPSEN